MKPEQISFVRLAVFMNLTELVWPSETLAHERRLPNGRGPSETVSYARYLKGSLNVINYFSTQWDIFLCPLVYWCSDMAKAVCKTGESSLIGTSRWNYFVSV